MHDFFTKCRKKYYGRQKNSLVEGGVDNVSREDAGEAEHREQLHASVLEDPVDQTFVGSIDRLLEDCHHSLGKVGHHGFLNSNFLTKLIIGYSWTPQFPNVLHIKNPDRLF